MVLVHPATIEHFDHKWMETSFRQDVQEEVANRLKKARLIHGYSQTQVAASLHLSQSAISKYESGLVMPDLLVLLTFCHLYGREFSSYFDCPFFRMHLEGLPPTGI
ncbi:helix-turn-helix domain-containing protein [Fructobacillus sp. M1-13]|uniref:Helix-turn-helix transcriptional regulator n=1 Tax=Fructobacillus papyriferae TaxID=2713171 RepID=A0ABS5QQK1_9LACO|nr:helix-turn-helix transcriptional regulator [Fructobacillus papyriferae]MBS9335468.1 helix-turn-helix transcriptional regulator [Fructobacillus papyriferae]MCD2159238.1 helix-turn-helix domain-containing protein [Fructobacillus papyriferae]